MTIKGNMRNTYGKGTVLYLGCVIVNILIVIPLGATG